MARLAALIYGVVCYVMFLGVFLYLIGFMGNFWVPKSIDSEALVPLNPPWVINVLLLAVFGLQHTPMARPTFKKWWTKTVPSPIERATYVLITNLALILLFVLWQPMGNVIWDVQNPVGRGVLWGLFAAGWLLVLVTTFLINHFDVFGLRQVWLYFTGRKYTYLGFVQPGIYKYIRHPLYVGWMAGFWATPTMTASHLVFAIGTTLYILIAIQFEERNLAEYLGDDYREYRRRTGWFLPRPGRAAAVSTQPQPGINPPTSGDG